MYSINCAKRKERKLRWVFLSLCLNFRKPLIQLRLSYAFLFFDYSFLLSLMRLEGAGIQKNAQEKREKASPVFSFFRSCLWTLYMFSIFCLFMDFSFVYFSVVLGSLWRVIYLFSVDLVSKHIPQLHPLYYATSFAKPCDDLPLSKKHFRE